MIDDNMRRIVEKYQGMTPYDKLALTEEQQKAVKELEAAFKKCQDLNVGFAQDDTNLYAYNDEDVYDFDACYEDYATRDIDLHNLYHVDRSVYDTLNGRTEIAVSFCSTTFLAEGITH